MTREEALSILKTFRITGDKNHEAFDMAIKALEQTEPKKCGDCISREAALECLDWKYPDKLPRTKILELPSVEPERPTGSWITDGVIDEDGNITCRCSQCKHNDVHSYDKFVPFCWACGAKMMEVINDTD